MRTFTVYRSNPPEEYAEKGITNAGKTADFQGVVFDDGTVVIRWLTQYKSHSIWENWTSLYMVHGHPEYGTIMEFDDGQPPPIVFADIVSAYPKEVGGDVIKGLPE